MSEAKDTPRMPEAPADFSALLAELDGGVLNQKLSAAVRDAAKGVAQYGDRGKAGKVVLELTINRFGESVNQVSMSHKISVVTPTRRGKVAEEDITETFLYVGQKGLSIMPDTQIKMFSED